MNTHVLPALIANQKRSLDDLSLMRDSPLEYFQERFQQEGDWVERNVLGKRLVFAFHPDAVQHVLVDKVAQYSKQTRGYQQLRHVLGNGLVTSEGSFWLRQRRIAQPAFARRRIAGFASVMLSEAEEFADLLADEGVRFDIAPKVMALTMRVATRALLGSHALGAEQVGRDLDAVLSVFTENTASLIPNRWLLPTAASREAKRALRRLEAKVEGFIEERRSVKTQQHDLLQMFMDVSDEETGEHMSDRQLRDEILTLFLAGYETTSNSILWTLKLLDDNPRVHARLLQALDSTESLDAETLTRLPYLRACIMESMRLRPPVWMNGRRAEVDDVIMGHRVKAGTTVLIVQAVTHRHPSFWQRPTDFEPERFVGKAERHKYAYFPFLGGPRQCIGKRFAEMELAIFLGTLLSRYKIEMTAPVVADASVTLRPAGGLYVLAKPRKKRHQKQKPSTE